MKAFGSAYSPVLMWAFPILGYVRQVLEDCGNSERTSLAFSCRDLGRVRDGKVFSLSGDLSRLTCKDTVVLPQVIARAGGSRNNLLRNVQCPVMHRPPAPASLMVEWMKASRLLSSTTHSQSGMRANSSASSSCSLSLNLLEYETETVPDWNPEFLNACITQEALRSVWSCCLPAMPACLSLCQSIFVYTDQCQSQDNQQLHEESRGSDSRLHDGWLQHFKPCVLGFDTVCSGMFPGALWFSLLGILCPLFLLRKKISSSPQSHSKKNNKNLLCSSRLKPWLKITGPEAELPPNSASFSFPLASFLLLTRSPDTCPLHGRCVSPGSVNAILVTF